MRLGIRGMLFLVLVALVGLSVTTLAEKLLIYTSCPLEIMTAIEQAFEAENPSIDLEIYRSGTGTVTAKIATELEVGNVVADLVWVADYAYYEGLKEQGLLYPYLSPMASGIPSVLVEPDGYYYGARLFSMVIAYNPTTVTEPPTRWIDLIDPVWDGQVVTGNPEYSGSNVVAATALGMKYGLTYFENLRANNITVVRSNSQAAAEVASGAYQIAFTLDNSVRQLKAEGSPIELIYPEDGAVLLPSPLGIISTTEHIDAAKVFVDYVLSDAGQQALVDFGSYIPIRSTVNPPAGAPTLEELTGMSIDLSIEFLLNTQDFFSEQFLRILLDQ
jgi:iron(III) transport system substrate-binding protein